MKVIAFLGHSGCGKDTAAICLALRTGITYEGSLSKYLLPEVCAVLQCPISHELFLERHKYRDIWKKCADELREKDPLVLVRRSLKNSPLITGFRSRKEFEAAKKEKLIDLTIWIERDVFFDPTLELDKDDADIIIENIKTIGVLNYKMLKLAKFAGIPITKCGNIGIDDIEVERHRVLYQACAMS